MLSQEKYVVEILKGFRMMDWEFMTMLMTMDFCDTTSGRVDTNLFRQLIGSRPDRCFTVNTLGFG